MDLWTPGNKSRIKKGGEVEPGRPRMQEENYFFLFTAALKAAPAENLGTVAAAIFKGSPVRGFLPLRAARLAALKVPKPIN